MARKAKRATSKRPAPRMVARKARTRYSDQNGRAFWLPPRSEG